jgi:hypothetical protein
MTAKRITISLDQVDFDRYVNWKAQSTFARLRNAQAVTHLFRIGLEYAVQWLGCLPEDGPSRRKNRKESK